MALEAESDLEKQRFEKEKETGDLWRDMIKSLEKQIEEKKK